MENNVKFVYKFAICAMLFSVIAEPRLSMAATNPDLVLTANITSLSLIAGESSSIEFTFSNDLPYQTKVKHVNYLSVLDKKNCIENCIEPVIYSASPFYVLAPEQSYQFTVPVTALPSGGVMSGAANIEATVFSETLLTTGRPYVRVRDTTRLLVPVTISGASPPAPAASVSGGSPVSGAVPEPTAWALMLVGLAGVGATLRATRARMEPRRNRLPA